jgi:hypothetical protein
MHERIGGRGGESFSCKLVSIGLVVGRNLESRFSKTPENTGKIRQTCREPHQKPRNHSRSHTPARRRTVEKVQFEHFQSRLIATQIPVTIAHSVVHAIGQADRHPPGDCYPTGSPSMPTSIEVQFRHGAQWLPAELDTDFAGIWSVVRPRSSRDNRRAFSRSVRPLRIIGGSNAYSMICDVFGAGDWGESGLRCRVWHADA